MSLVCRTKWLMFFMSHIKTTSAVCVLCENVPSCSSEPTGYVPLSGPCKAGEKCSPGPRAVTFVPMTSSGLYKHISKLSVLNPSHHRDSNPDLNPERGRAKPLSVIPSPVLIFLLRLSNFSILVQPPIRVLCIIELYE